MSTNEEIKEGKRKQAKGKIREGVGKLTGDKGEDDRAKGTALKLERHMLVYLLERPLEDRAHVGNDTCG